MDSPLTIGIAGCGRIAERGYVPALALVPELRLVGAADPNPGRRRHLASASPDHPRAFASVAEMIDATRPDGIVIATPPELHLEHAELATRAGAAALVEKPPGRGPEEALRLADLERVWIGFNRRFSHLPAVAGRVPGGDGLRVELRISYRRASWRPHEVSDDALADLGPHLADLAGCLLGGELESVRAVTATPRRAEAELAGRRGSARLLCETDAPWRERVSVRDCSGRLVARSAHGGLARGLAARVRGKEHPLVASLAAQLRAFAGAIGGGGAGSLATAADGARAMSALDAARRSAAGGGSEVAI